MADTPNLLLGYMEASQSQKHVTFNEALLALDAIVQLAILDKDLTAPPVSPAEGDRYYVATGATGLWLGMSGKIAAYQDAAWNFYPIREGWMLWASDEDKAYAFNGTTLVPVAGSASALSDITAPAIIGRNTAGVGDVEVLTPATARTVLGLATTSNPTFGNLTVTNLTVNGTATNIKSTTVTVNDVIFTLGGDTAPTVNDGKDRGIEFRWHNGTLAKNGFFGFDASTTYMFYIPDAVNTAEVISGPLGTARFDLYADKIGIGAAPDNTNKLTVTSAASLFNHIGAGTQIKINKNATLDTASIVFQTGFSGRAEIGNTGDNDFHFKVSADGSAFFESLWITSASGMVTVKNGFTLDAQASDPLAPVNGQLWYNSTLAKLRTAQSGTVTDVQTPVDSGFNLALMNGVFSF